MTLNTLLFRCFPAGKRGICLFLTLVLLAISLGTAQPPVTAAPLRAVTLAPQTDFSEMFGMVIRDPFYEYNTDPVNYPNAANRTALEQQAIELASLGVRWVRMEFFADYDGSVRPGDINWAKYDWFINELAPRYGLKILALLNVGMVAHDGRTLRTLAFNDPPDRAGTDPDDGSNHFIRVFSARAQAIAARYGTAISAYEIINEPNISFDLWLDSGHGSAEIKPDRYAALITNAYRAIKGVQPRAEVIVGGLMIGSPPEGEDHDQFDYLYQLYVSPWVERYRTLGLNTRPGWSNVPWDGIALHPYFIETPELFALLKDFARKMRDRDDHKSKLWITEVGAQAKPAGSAYERPSDEEVKQADYLRGLYGGILKDSELRSTIAHTFWFKYEDFVPGNYTHNYGLVRLMENEKGDNYSPSGRVWVRKLAYRVYQELAYGYGLSDPVDEVEAREDNLIYFPETRQAIAPAFANFWQQKGGMGRFGYPISRPVIYDGYLTQFFERGVFEHHPEYAGTSSEVLLRLVGVEFTRGQKFDKPDTVTLPPDRYYFPETEHSLGGVFLNYWRDNGGLEVYGYPISEELTEISPTDGKAYTVQYFERNRFEHHPEAAGTQFEVQLGLLGANLLQADRWWRR